MTLPLEDALGFGKFEVERVISGGIMGQLTALVGQLKEFKPRDASVVNERCHVSVAGLGLLSITEVCVKENYCTNELQGDLKDGWRIIAICVQPDQRRPDYVLGRSAQP